jgi:hypothetical protein
MITTKLAKTNTPKETDELGPNGYRVGYTENGDKVEWLPDQENPGEEIPMLLRRNDEDIKKACQEFWDKVWWNRYQVRLQREGDGWLPRTESERVVMERAKQAAKRIEEIYGKENLGWSDFEWGLLSGRLSALNWVRGDEWDESLDT